MTVDMSKYERLIIEKDRKYLTCIRDMRPEYHWSPYHAWWDKRKRRDVSKQIARSIGGKVRRFNPITGEVR